MSPLGIVCLGYLILGLVLLVVCCVLAPERPNLNSDQHDDLDRLR